MEVHDRHHVLPHPHRRRILRQPPPRLRGLGPGRDEPLCDVPREGEPSLIHLLDLRRRYRAETATMRSRLLALQVALEDCSRQMCHQLTAGRATPARLRARGDDLVQAVGAAERDLADAHLAIEGIGQEIAALVGARQRS